MMNISPKSSESGAGAPDADLAHGASARPITRAEEMRTASLPTKVANTGMPSPRVLVVDDDDQYRTLVVRVLESVGLRVSQACDGLKALEAYSQGSREGAGFDLVLLDLGLPVMNGRECLQKLVEMDGTAKVMITSGSDPFDELPMEIRKLARGFLQKPFSLKDLIAKLQTILGRNLAM